MFILLWFDDFFIAFLYFRQSWRKYEIHGGSRWHTQEKSIGRTRIPKFYACLILPTTKASSLRNLFSLSGYTWQRSTISRSFWWQTSFGLHQNSRKAWRALGKFKVKKIFKGKAASKVRRSKIIWGTREKSSLFPYKRTAFFSGTPNYFGPSYFDLALAFYYWVKVEMVMNL